MSKKNRAARQMSGELQNVTAAEVGSVASVVGEQSPPPSGNPFKYEGKQKPAAEAKLHYSPTWAKREYTFIPGNVSPKGDKSVMGILRSLVVQSPGIVGSQLAVMLRFHNFPNPTRSRYLNVDAQGKKVSAIPAIGWAEGYIDGAVTKGYLKIAKGSEITNGRSKKGAKAEPTPESTPAAESTTQSADESTESTETTAPVAAETEAAE